MLGQFNINNTKAVAVLSDVRSLEGQTAYPPWQRQSQSQLTLDFRNIKSVDWYGNFRPLIANVRYLDFRRRAWRQSVPFNQSAQQLVCLTNSMNPIGLINKQYPQQTVCPTIGPVNNKYYW